MSTPPPAISGMGLLTLPPPRPLQGQSWAHSPHPAFPSLLWGWAHSPHPLSGLGPHPRTQSTPSPPPPLCRAGRRQGQNQQCSSSPPCSVLSIMVALGHAATTAADPECCWSTMIGWFRQLTRVWIKYYGHRQTDWGFYNIRMLRVKQGGVLWL